MDLEKAVLDLLNKHNIEFALTLPCAKFLRLLELTSEQFKHIPLSREEEGVGIASGIYLAGKRSVMMIQSGGIGNSLNALLSLALVYRIPIPIIISWRGIYNEAIEAQIPVGKYLPAIFKAIEFPFVEIRKEEDLKKIDYALSNCFEKSIPFGIFISPQFWELSEYLDEPFKEYSETKSPFPKRDTEFTLTITSTKIAEPIITRYEAIETLKPLLQGKVVVSNIGSPCKELFAVIDQPTNFYMLGSFGLASAIGLGIALICDKEVVVIDGDASILTNPNILETIIQEKNSCKNLTILLMDNGTCGSTGNQLTTAFNNIDLELLARAYGFIHTRKAYTPEELVKAFNQLERGPRLIHCIIKPANAFVRDVPLSAIDIKERFQKSFRK
ncbi:MAG: sulfopyruvate decarboxylase subunit alpha [Candidatus Heimdallarchaeota archaeon]|nr:sulfopyruvate decarboxylase subunit alpha [Candidatus Heimdallarchaeota archaeon]